MAGGGGSGGGGGPNKARELDHTSTWAVSTVCGVIIVISIVLEKALHRVGQIANTMWFCPPRGHGRVTHKDSDTYHHRRLTWYERRILAGSGPSQGCKKGYVPLISLNALHQLQIFIFFLAVFHVIYSAITMMLGRAKIRAWKEWELEVMNEHEMMNDPTRFRLSHETSFVREHISPWTKTAISFYIVCLFRQFLRSVRKSDYMTMRHGFISVHLAPTMRFNFQKYIKRSLEDDFKVVVGIRPMLWAFVMLFILVDVYGWHYTAVITMIPPVVTLAVGTKLQAIISQMAIEIQERHAVSQGMPLVQVSDRHFWFGRPHLVLHLIHFVLFQNAFEITYFFWIWYEFGLRSCFHQNFNLVIIRVCLGVGVQIICSYITLPLYALVTQMGSTMKRSIFDEQTSRALKQWHKEARKRTESRSEHHVGTRMWGGPTNSPLQSAVATKRLWSKSTSDVETGAPDSNSQTVNIMATVDLNGGDHHGPRDLLTP